MLRLLIKLFGFVLAPIACKFYQALKAPQTAQRKVQAKICDRLIKSEYGKFLGIKSIADWQRIPVVDYDDIASWIVKQQTTNSPILTPEPILFYEKTSGSRGCAKTIPYPKSLRTAFNQMFCVWAHDLIMHGLTFTIGKIYFCISPQLGEDTTGLNDDSEYLDRWLRWLLRPFLVSPSGLNQIRHPEEFKHKLAQTLLLEENLEIISIWSPTFLKVLLDYMQTHQMQLYAELDGQISTQRGSLLLESSIPWTQIWTKLKLISCWDSAQAKEQAQFLRSLFPGVTIQGKGLLATEAPMTIPLLAAKGCLPLVDIVFFEFEDIDGNIYQLHELEIGQEYGIVISQTGGLYRYRIGDRIRVSHFYLATPCLEFLGRTETTSDLVGEKLHEEFVRQTLEELELAETFFKSLVPATQPQEHYILLLDTAKEPAATIARRLDEALKRSPQYNYARCIGQLSKPRAIVSPQIPELITTYKTRFGSKWGDIKHEILFTTPITTDFLTVLEKLA